MKQKLKRKSENWRRKLPRPIVMRGGRTLKLLSDCRDYRDVSSSSIKADAPNFLKSRYLIGSTLGSCDICDPNS